MSAGAEDLLSPELLEFQLFDWLKVAAGEDRDTLLAVFDSARRLALDAFLTHYRESDISEPYLDAAGAHVLPAIRTALARYAELGLFGAGFPEELGGFGLSFAASLAIQCTIAAANAPTAGYTMLTIANARLICTFGSPKQIEQFARPEIEGRWFGTMCLSEPQAGSSLADIRTRADPNGEDELGARYRLRGNKMWISGGDHDASENIVHLVLAKIALADGGLPQGTKGISLFIVPKWLPDGRRNDIAVAGLNHKMGNRGTTNCLLNFGERDGAIGWRVGEPGQGLPQMFMMMNEARISVGAGAATLGYRGYRQSLQYARERVQGRPVGTKGGAPVRIIEHPDVRRMLLQQKAYAEGALAICFYCAHLLDRRSEDAQALLALLTPVAKSWPADFGLIANDLAIQIHGGYGYTRDFDVEQLWRDNRLNAIHEGTTGIQAIDLLGRKLLHSDGRSLHLLQELIAKTVQRAKAHSERAGFAASLQEFWEQVAGIIQDLKGSGPEAFDDATVFLRAFGHGVIAWLWLDQAVTAASLPSNTHRSSVGYACRYFFESELPQARCWLSIFTRHSTLIRSMPGEALV